MPVTPQHRSSTRRSVRTYGRYFATLATFTCLALASLALYVHFFHLPAPTGSYAVGTQTFDLTDPTRRDPFTADSARRREIVVQLWYPAAPSAARLAPYMRWREAGLHRFYAPLLRTHSHLSAAVADAGEPFPVLLFNHRWGGERTQNTVLAEELASHGFVVASIDHPHNSSRVLLAEGNVISGHEALEGPEGEHATAAQQIEFWNSNLQLWAADSRFVLDQLAAKSANPADPFYGKLDTGRVGAFGHSFGGAVSLALCGLDPRVTAAANLDGWTFGGLRSRTTAQPILLLYEGSSQSRERQLAALQQPGTSGDQLDRADFAATEASLKTFGGIRLFVTGTQHMDFSDEPLLPPFRRLAYTGPIKPDRVNRILGQSLLQFFGSTLRGENSPLFAGEAHPVPELTVERWTATGRPARR